MMIYHIKIEAASAFFLCLYCLILITTSKTNAQSDVDRSPCKTAQNCSDCLIHGPQCTWCYKMEYKSSQRCDTVENHSERGCVDSSIVSPTSIIRPKQDAPVRNADIINSLPAIQLSPQKLKLKLQPGRPVSFDITFRIADDYPVDLYYIMDLSYSMQDDQENLIRLGVDIADELKKITRNVRLGFGAFVDKPILPFMGTREISVNNPCFPFDECKPTYGFINRLSLTNDTSVFGAKVRETPISGNQDGPEGGMDALLQAMACSSDIGWQDRSRRIIVYSTDAQSHIAADAKIAGIVEPNDGYCHLSNNEYTHTLMQDYPSVSQIANLAKETSTNIIFAVSEYKEEYLGIAREIPNSIVGELARDSSNIVTLVREKYYNLIQTVALSTTGLTDADGISVKLKTNCSSTNGEFHDSAVCESVGIGQEIHYKAEISIASCAQGNRNKKFKIKPADLSDSMIVDVEIICACECDDELANSDECNGRGTFRCGKCECNTGYSGDQCECDGTASEVIGSNMCLNPLSNLTCSGNGDCTSCGTCKCDCLPGESGLDCERYSGPFCECNTKSCDRKNGLLCAGHGTCTCERHKTESYCDCDQGFLKQDCSCPVSTLTCRPQNGTGEICNSKGQCTCGKCECTDACYEGRTCDFLKPECSSTCRSFRGCVVCKVRPEEASLCQDESLCSTYDIQLGADLFSIDEDGTCFHTDMQECKHYYKYQYNHEQKSWTVLIDNTAYCQKDYWLEIIIGICVGVLLLGILTLVIWKVVVTLHDKREFAKFEKEALQAKWNSTNNPLYKPATTTFQNPTYNGTANDQTKPVDL